MLRRHLDYADDVPVTQLGPAALDDLLERGDLESWVPLVRAIESDPEGVLADTILRLCESHPIYGTSSLWRTWIERLGSRSGGLVAMRKGRGLSQQQIAQRLGISQSDVSKLERRGDLRISTLKAYLAAAGGRLRIKAVFPEKEIDLDIIVNRRRPK